MSSVVMLMAADRLRSIICASSSGQDSLSTKDEKLRPLAWEVVLASGVPFLGIGMLWPVRQSGGVVEVAEPFGSRVQVAAEHEELFDADQPALVGIPCCGPVDEAAQ